MCLLGVGARTTATTHCHGKTAGGNSICFNCYTHITNAEAKWCSRCKLGCYCSPACQQLHWAIHKKTCEQVETPAPTPAPAAPAPAPAAPVETAIQREERERRENDARAARLERAEQIRRHDERESLAAAEEAAAQSARRLAVAKERALRLEKAAEDVERRERLLAQEAESKRASSKKKSGTSKASKMASTEARLIHDAWISPGERTARQEAALANNMVKHLEAVARKAKEKADGLKKLQASVEKEIAAQEHFVPPPPTLASFLESSLALE